MTLLSKTTEIATIFLYVCYSCMFLLVVEAEWYDNSYLFLSKIDTSIFILSLLGGIFFISKWEDTSKICFIYVVLLNILTDVDAEVEIPSYYVLYEFCIISSILTIFSLSVRQ